MLGGWFLFCMELEMMGWNFFEVDMLTRWMVFSGSAVTLRKQKILEIFEPSFGKGAE